MKKKEANSDNSESEWELTTVYKLAPRWSGEIKSVFINLLKITQSLMCSFVFFMG